MGVSWSIRLRALEAVGSIFLLLSSLSLSLPRLAPGTLGVNLWVR